MVKRIFKMVTSANRGGAPRPPFVLLVVIFALGIIRYPKAWGQEASAVVTGVVTDPSGAAVPNAEVQLTNVNTAVTRTTQTNTQGNYIFLNVTPGTYTMRVSAPGFSVVTQPPVTLQVNQTANFNFHLQVGQASTTVTVEAAAAGVETATAELGTVVNTHEVNNLPLNGRNFTELLTITPGVANVNRDQSGGSGGGGFVGAAIGAFAFPSIDGARVRSNTFLLD